MVGFRNGHEDKIKLDKSYHSIPRFRKTDTASQIEKKVSAINLTAHTTKVEQGPFTVVPSGIESFTGKLYCT